MIRTVASLIAVAGLACVAAANTPFVTPLNTFGNNGWRAPHVVLSGDSAGSAGPSSTTFLDTYKYLQSSIDTTFGGANLERGMAFNPATGNLILVSRSNAGGGIRIINGQTGRDAGGLTIPSGFLSGGAFTTNKVGITDDGHIFVANLSTNIGSPTVSNQYKVYRWASETDTTPSVFFNAPITHPAGGTLRLGDSFDVAGRFGDGSVRLASGVSGTNGRGVVVIDNTATAQVLAGSAATTNAGDFRLAISFNKDPVTGQPTEIWGRQPGGPPTGPFNAGRRIAFPSGTFLSNLNAPPAGVNPYAGGFSAQGETAIDITTFNIGGTEVPFLAALDVNNSRIRIYNISDPTNWVLSAATPFGTTTTTPPLDANGNATGEVKWGGVTLDANGFPVATIYAMSSNQGIQAFSFSVVPAPGAAALLGLGGLLAARRRRA